MSGAVSHGVILHRGLMCSDENASESDLLEHVLWYHPRNEDERRRLDRLRVIESLLAFGRTFTSDERLDSVLLSRSLYVFLEVEAEIWMVWVVDRDAEPNAVRSSMCRAYDERFLTRGRILDYFDEAGREAVTALRIARKESSPLLDEKEEASPTTALRRELENDDFLLPLRKPRVLDDMVGFEHCGAEPSTFLAAHRAYREIATALPVAAATLFWRSSLLWNGLELGSALQLYASVKKALYESEETVVGFLPQPGASKGETVWRVHLASNQTTPHSLDSTHWGRATRTAESAEGDVVSVLVYKATDDLGVLLFLRRKNQLRDLQDAEARLHVVLSPLSASLKLRPPKIRGSLVEGCDFVYFNRANASLKLAFTDPLPSHALRAIDDANHAFLLHRDNIQEIALPFPNEAGWLVAKQNYHRILFILLDSRYADFRQAQAALQGLKAGLLSNIVVLP